MNTYTKGQSAILADNCNRFIYEVSIVITYQSLFSVAGVKYFSSPTEISNVIESFKIHKYMEICCSLYSAPLGWLLDNDYSPYSKLKKKTYKKKVQ
jgi:hypothetical protein